MWIRKLDILWEKVAGPIPWRKHSSIIFRGRTRHMKPNPFSLPIMRLEICTMIFQIREDTRCPSNAWPDIASWEVFLCVSNYGLSYPLFSLTKYISNIPALGFYNKKA